MKMVGDASDNDHDVATMKGITVNEKMGRSHVIRMVNFGEKWVEVFLG